MEDVIPKLKRGKLIHVRLSPVTHHKLRIHVAELNTTIQDWVTSTIRNALRKSRKKKKGDGDATE